MELGGNSIPYYERIIHIHTIKCNVTDDNIRQFIIRLGLQWVDDFF